MDKCYVSPQNMCAAHRISSQYPLTTNTIRSYCFDAFETIRVSECEKKKLQVFENHRQVRHAFELQSRSRCKIAKRTHRNQFRIRRSSLAGLLFAASPGHYRKQGISTVSVSNRYYKGETKNLYLCHWVNLKGSSCTEKRPAHVHVTKHTIFSHQINTRVVVGIQTSNLLPRMYLLHHLITYTT